MRINALKERIFGAVTVMNEKETRRLWGIIADEFGEGEKDWDLIPEEAPDEIDLQMLKEIGEDSDCHEFIPANEAEKILGIA
ncbi:MAG: hypothetical protein IJM82_02410 [Synergistaceae bacterium]|nr:hypothetical protein [Synergistaceae bacterium]MBQ6737710.1 hypothetical protein [Synergistaceae bacterium]MBQ7068001.1 hypothetical protein [Synergistaceae bacterium]MBR0075876.1 hypothetical protein [Synergistaceae bacterium]MBR0080939.1 hypothetical protein [Synergistaceae bacterium]